MLKKYTYLCIYYNPLKFSSYERDNIMEPYPYGSSMHDDTDIMQKSDNSNPSANDVVDGSIVNPNPKWKNCEKAVYFDALEQESDALKQVLNARCIGVLLSK